MSSYLIYKHKKEVLPLNYITKDVCPICGASSKPNEEQPKAGKYSKVVVYKCGSEMLYSSYTKDIYVEKECKNPLLD